MSQCEIEYIVVKGDPRLYSLVKMHRPVKGFIDIRYVELAGHGRRFLEPLYNCRDATQEEVCQLSGKV